MSSPYNVELINGYVPGQNFPYKFFRVNNPGLGAWTYAVIENTAPESPETIKVYMANESDLVLTFKTDQERYALMYDSNNNPIPIPVLFTANLTQGGDGETSGLNDHTETAGEPVTDAIIAIQVTSPDGQIVQGRMEHIGNGEYTITLNTIVLGNYDVEIIASDANPGALGSNQTGTRNSEYLITTEHSFFISPFEKPRSFTGKLYIEKGLEYLQDIMTEYCPDRKNCSLDKNAERDISNAISLIETALTYFENDGDHLKTRKGLDFYDNMTSAVNRIYSYISDPSFGSDIDQSIYYLREGSYLLAVIARDEAEESDCNESNCEQLIGSSTSELGKAIDETKQENYVYVFNHLTNAWKFAQNAMGANLKKEINADVAENVMPAEFGLAQNYPNPFNPSTTINYQLPENSKVNISIYDILGNLVAELVDGEIEAGYHIVRWNAANYANGVYFYTIKAGPYVTTKKLVLLK
jgi:hypothetical protein